MKYQVARLQLFFICLMGVALIAVGCGEKASDEKAAESGGDKGSSTETPATTTPSSSGVADYVKMQEEIVTIIEGINSKADVDAAEPKLNELYNKMIDRMAVEVKDPSIGNSVENTQRLKELNERQAAHLRELATKDPAAVAALGMIMAKNSTRIAAIMGEAMKNMDQKDVKAMQKAMEEVKKKIEGK